MKHFTHEDRRGWKITIAVAVIDIALIAALLVIVYSKGQF